MSARLAAAGVFLVLGLPGLPSAAQPVSDPTQPPAALMAAPASGAPAVAAAPELQSVLISHNPGGRKLALINGQLLRPGERFGNAVVVAIAQTEVTLRRGRTLEKLKLFPPMEAGGAGAGKP